MLVAGGPFADESGGVNILAGSPETLDVPSLYAHDPFIVHGMFVLERLVPWLVVVQLAADELGKKATKCQWW